MSDTFDQQLRQIIPIAERWKELQAERNSIAMEGARIVRRLDELRPLCGTEAEFEQMEAIETELHQVDQTLNRNEARLDAIDKEIEPLNQQLDQFGELLARMKKGLS